MYRFLQTQISNMKKKDWISQVLTDIKELGLDLNLEDIKTMKKSKLKNKLNNAVKEKTFKDLQDKKISHSKVMDIKHTKLEMQRYLKANKSKISQEEAQTIFRMRSRTTEVNLNFRGQHETFECDVCHAEDDNQEHLIKCTQINKHKNNEGNIPDYKNCSEII